MSHLQCNRQQHKRIIKRRPPRSKIQIYGDLLRILDGEAGNKKIVLTKIQLKIDVPFDRLKTYISELQLLDLIEDIRTLKVTRKGKHYIQEYGDIIQSLQKMSEIIKARSPEPVKRLL